MTERANRRKVMTGTVISNKMDKTCVVQISWHAKHKKYLKPVKRSQKYKTHDEKNETQPGNLVEIMETRPLSKDKRWILKKILKKEVE
ncbi:MAG: 30S ribosomal protein S17 [Candidatus Omnitrophica bacterium]|nr:30S ribosomal protein S17 [Candidatus Omnitrophota bacterium]